MGLFRAAHGWGGEKKAPLPEIFHTCPTMMKLGKVTPYLKIYMVNIIVFLWFIMMNIFYVPTYY